MNHCVILSLFLLHFFILINGRENIKQNNYNANNDFLLHEANQRNPSQPKRDYVAPQYPNLSTPSASVGGVGENHKVKDLINYYDNQGKQQNGPNKVPSYSSILQGSSGNHQQGNNLNKAENVGQYSSSTKLNPGSVTPTPQTPKPGQTNKPFSYSSIVAGTNKPSTPIINNLTPSFKPGTYPLPTPSMPMNVNPGNNPTSSINKTPTPATNFKPSSVTNSSGPGTSTKPILSPNGKPSTPIPAKPGANNNPTLKPNSPVLPSSIVHNQQNKNSQSNGPTDLELQTLSEELLRKDNNNAAQYITINYQEKTTSQSKDDRAPLPLLTISDAAWNIPTIKKFLPLLDNYERDTLVNEYVTPQERNEENAFMDVIMTTPVIRHLMNFLKNKGYVTPDPRQQRDFLKQLWFGLYSRGKGKISSSGFEHIFVSELKNGEVSGLHNWIYFSKEESVNRVNYLGYLKYAQLNDKGAVLKLHFNQQGVDKPVDSMFIGTSPELEMALYTLCFITRADRDCNCKLGGKNVDIVTHTFRYRSKNLIGSAYPQI